MSGGIKVEGFAELDALLGELPVSVRRRVVLKAMHKAGEPIAADARARAARGRDPRKRGSKKQRDAGEGPWIGAAADSIQSRPVRQSETNTVVTAIGVDAAHWYLKFVEFGTARQAAQRPVTQAFEANKEEALDLLGIELWESISGEAARLARAATKGTLTSRTAAELAK